MSNDELIRALVAVTGYFGATSNDTSFKEAKETGEKLCEIIRERAGSPEAK